MQITRAAYSLAIDTGADTLTLTAKGQDRPLLTLTWPLLLAPQFAGAGDARPGPASLETLPDGGIRLTAPLPAGIGGSVSNTLYLRDDRIVCIASYRAAVDHAVAHWLIAPPGSQVGAERLHAYMGGPGISTNGRSFDPADADISTAGHNYAYAITGPRVTLRRGAVACCLGGTSLANDFGLNLRLRDSMVEHLRFNYGGDKPTHLPAATTHHGPRLQVLFSTSPEDDTVHGQFVQTLHDDGIITYSRYSPEQQVWRRPIYCTWGDQLIAGKTFAAGQNWRGQKKSNMLLDTDFVRRCAHAIRDADLNIGTFVIDAGWQDFRGDWNPDSRKFPNLRGLVDELHAMGFKVMMWWAPLQVEEGAAVLDTPLVAPPNRHGDRFLNYERPETRAHIEGILQRFFSSGPDGWDIDGLKLDWMVERVYAQDPPHDLAWRGEERCLNQIYRLVHRIAAEHKQVFCIWGGAGENPHLSPYSTMRGMEERFDSANLDYIERHYRLVTTMRPGLWVRNHLNYDPEHAVEAIRRVIAQGGVPEIGLVLPEHISAESMARTRAVLAPVGRPRE